MGKPTIKKLKRHKALLSVLLVLSCLLIGYLLYCMYFMPVTNTVTNTITSDPEYVYPSEQYCTTEFTDWSEWSIWTNENCTNITIQGIDVFILTPKDNTRALNVTDIEAWRTNDTSYNDYLVTTVSIPVNFNVTEDFSETIAIPNNSMVFIGIYAAIGLDDFDGNSSITEYFIDYSQITLDPTVDFTNSTDILVNLYIDENKWMTFTVTDIAFDEALLAASIDWIIGDIV